MNGNKVKKIGLILGDIVLLYGSLWVALLIRYRQLPSQNLWHTNWLPFTVLFVVWVVVFYINDLYEIAVSRNDVSFYNKLLRNLFINFAIGAAYFYLLTDKLFSIKPQTVFFIFIAVVTVVFALWRFWFNSFLGRPDRLKNVLLVGLNDEAMELVEEIIKKPQLGYRITSILHDGDKSTATFSGVSFYDSSSDIKSVLKRHGISTIVVANDLHADPRLVKNLYDTLSYKLQFFDLPRFYELLTGKIPVTTIGHMWFLENLAEGDKRFYETTKRLIDITAALCGLIIAAPFVPLIALVIRWNSKGPILFRQIRSGQLGQTFTAVKFRSMVTGAEKDGQPQWATKNDPRVTGIGRWLRKLRLDEIPQLVNILKGEMSLIGPRPERPDFVQQLQQIIPFYNERHLVKPGLTGWAQINYGYSDSPKGALKKLQYDLFYIKNRSLPLDVGIVLKTIKIILTGRGR